MFGDISIIGHCSRYTDSDHNFIEYPVWIAHSLESEDMGIRTIFDSVTSHFFSGEKVMTEPIYEYDSNGNEIHAKYSNGYEVWREYDDNGRVIYYKNSNGYEEWLEYDSNGNLIHFKDSNGFESWYGYDDSGNEIYYKDSNGVEEHYD